MNILVTFAFLFSIAAIVLAYRGHKQAQRTQRTLAQALAVIDSRDGRTVVVDHSDGRITVIKELNDVQRPSI